MSEMGNNLLQEWIRCHDEVKAQRNQLSEALSSIVECWDGPLYKHEMFPLIQQSRAALKQLEEE